MDGDHDRPPNFHSYGGVFPMAVHGRLDPSNHYVGLDAQRLLGGW